MASEHDCPICSARVATRSDLRTHLLVDHRKSELVRTVAGESADRSDDVLAT